jgi:hypothetical protein
MPGATFLRSTGAGEEEERFENNSNNMRSF